MSDDKHIHDWYISADYEVLACECGSLALDRLTDDAPPLYDVDLIVDVLYGRFGSEEARQLRMRLTNRYAELKNQGMSFAEANRQAAIEWLESYLGREAE
jgi:hypothetical protein